MLMGEMKVGGGAIVRETESQYMHLHGSDPLWRGRDMMGFAWNNGTPTVAVAGLRVAT